MVAFNSFICRLVTILHDNNGFHDELTNIKRIAAANGHNESIIYNLLRRHPNKSEPLQ